MTAERLATRTVTGVVAGMIVATAAATAVGFWLSYDGLHDFALRAGLSGPEGWAWPASVDLFIAAGEAGVTISALRHRQDRAAWGYLALGFAASVTANVLHVDTTALHWTRYAVAAVPPVAAMLALAALLRQVYRLAEQRAPGSAPEVHPDAVLAATASASPDASGPQPEPASAPASEPARPRRPRAQPDRSRPAVSDADAEVHFAADLAASEVPSARRIQRELHVGQPRANALHQHLETLTTART